MTFTVVYDANVLYPGTVDEVLLRLERNGLIESSAALRA
ncbi:MAG: hypothetical protein V7637_215 [Mycobacteriales bacterium]|jgi:DNA-binding PadR family transcriptional regulator